MAVMALETAYTFSPKIGTFKDDPNDNRKGGYVGLIQFGKGAAIDLKIKRSELLKMSAEDQLDWVEKYFNLPQFKDKNLFINKTALYLAVNYPDSCKHASNKDYVVYDSSDAAYDDNDLFKREKHEYKIVKGKKVYPDDIVGSSYVWEFEEAINDVAKMGEKHKVKTFTCGIGNIETPLNAKDIITYHIYENGTIEKHIPQKIKEEYKQKYKYVYHDKEKNQHEVCIVDWFMVDKRKNGSKISNIPKGYVSTYNYPSGGNAQIAYVYSNGDICVSGTKYGYRKYSKAEDLVPLVRMKDNLSYEKDGINIFYSFQNSQR